MIRPKLRLQNRKECRSAGDARSNPNFPIQKVVPAQQIRDSSQSTRTKDMMSLASSSLCKSHAIVHSVAISPFMPTTISQATS